MVPFKAALRSTKVIVVALLLAIVAGASFATVAFANTPPDTPTIDAPKPTDPTNDDTPQFFFSTNDDHPEFGITFFCQVNGGGYSPCTTGDSFGPLADGSTTFDVFARDGAGSDSAPASYTWLIDTTPPDTFFTQTPPNPSKNPAKAFKFGAIETGSGLDRLECNLDGSGWSTCTSPYVPAVAPPDAVHTLEVRGVDDAGNIESTPASYTWLVDTTKPVVTVVVTEYTADGNLQYDPFAEPGRWARHSVTIDFVCVDPPNNVASGVATDSLPHGYAISTDGIYSILDLLPAQAKCQDAAGNRADLSFSDTINVNVDQHAPTCSVTPAVQYIPKNSPSNSGQTYFRSVSVSGDDGALPSGSLVFTLLSVSGPGTTSGWSIGSQTPTLDLGGRFEGLPGAVYTITYRVMDPAGFTSTCKAKVKTST